jgi:ketosteroid isomerase-like protein
VRCSRARFESAIRIGLLAIAPVSYLCLILAGQIDQGNPMTRSEEIKAIIARLYAARKNGDLDSILKFFDENATFAMSGSKQASGVAMEAKGTHEIRAAMTNLLNAYDMHDQTILSFLVDDEKAAVHHRSKLKFKPTGEVFDTETLDLWKLQGDKIVSVIEFVDTALAQAHLLQVK